MVPLAIVTFHSLDDAPAVISFPPRLFERAIERLLTRGHRPVALAEAARCLRRGVPFPRRAFVLTFDDGYETVYEEAFPVLRRSGLPATVFLTVGPSRASQRNGRLPSLCGRPMLTWAQIREMHAGGVDFGAHTLTHPDLTRLSAARIEVEVSESKRIIEDGLGASVSSFAYPFGRYDQRSRDIISRHFDCACSDRLGFVTPTSDPYALKRIDAYYLRSDRAFDLMATSLFPVYVRARNAPRATRRLVQAILTRWRATPPP